MANLQGFDANQVEPQVALEAVPAGKYMAVITASEIKPTKAGTGSYLKLTFEIIEGEYKGRKVWAQLNLENPNPTAVKIAQSELSAICRAVGILQPRDSQQLHDLPLQIHAKCKKLPDGDELVNEIKGYAAKEAASGQPQQAASDAPPWRRQGS